MTHRGGVVINAFYVRQKWTTRISFGYRFFNQIENFIFFPIHTHKLTQFDTVCQVVRKNSHKNGVLGYCVYIDICLIMCFDTVMDDKNDNIVQDGDVDIDSLDFVGAGGDEEDDSPLEPGDDLESRLKYPWKFKTIKVEERDFNDEKSVNNAVEMLIREQLVCTRATTKEKDKQGHDRIRRVDINKIRGISEVIKSIHEAQSTRKKIKEDNMEEEVETALKSVDKLRGEIEKQAKVIEDLKSENKELRAKIEVEAISG